MTANIALLSLYISLYNALLPFISAFKTFCSYYLNFRVIERKKWEDRDKEISHYSLLG